MIDLLKRWAKLEPERCKDYSGIFSIKMERRAAFWPIQPDDPTAVDLANLQRSLQNAIAAQDSWAFNLSLGRHISTGKQGYEAWVYRKDDAEPFIEWDDEAAIALLDAYVQALEAEQKRVGAIATGVSQ